MAALRPRDYTLYHGTSYGNWLEIVRRGLKPDTCLTSLPGIAAYYAEAASEDATVTPPAGVVGVVVEVSGVVSASLRYDRAAMDEPVAPYGGLKGSDLDRRASRALGAYRRLHPESYEPVTDSVSVPQEQFEVSLGAVFSVRCAAPLPAGRITRFRVLRSAGPTASFGERIRGFRPGRWLRPPHT